MVITQLIIDTMNNFHGTEIALVDLQVPSSSKIQEILPSPMEVPGEEPSHDSIVTKQENSKSREIIQYDTPELELVINDNNQSDEGNLQAVEISEGSEDQPLLQSSEETIVEPRRSARVA